MTNDTTQEVKFETHLNSDKGTVTVDLFDWMSQISEESRMNLFPLWESLAYDYMADALAHKFAGPHYDKAIHEMRIRLLTDEAAPKMMRELVRAFVHEVESAERSAKGYDEAYWTLFHAWPEGSLASRPHNPIPRFEPVRYINDSLTDGLVEMIAQRVAGIKDEE